MLELNIILIDAVASMLTFSQLPSDETISALQFMAYGPSS